MSGLGVLPGFSVFIDSSFQKKPISCSVLPRGRASQSAGRGAAVAVGEWADGVCWQGQSTALQGVVGGGHCGLVAILQKGKGNVFTTVFFL